MSRVDAAAPSDRLPWLSDEPLAKPAKRSGNHVLGWAAAAAVAVAGAGFWLGTRSVEEQPPASSKRTPPATTVRLPEPRSAEPQVRMTPQPQVNPAIAPQVHPAPAREVRIAPPPSVERPPSQEPEAASAPAEQAAEAVLAPAARSTQTPNTVIAVRRPQAMPLRAWQPRVVAGAAGRLVEVGAFGSVTQAKLGWRYMVRAYPAMARLPAVVRPDRNSKGRAFYRFRVGTTSQAHSEVLCQRMQRIRFSCAVVGLPWKAKVER
jgi:outer membrane biosynthesis protein TonB